MVILNKYGFYSLADQPTTEELEEYYANKYYQDGEVYQHEYTAEEILYFNNKIAQKHQNTIELGLIEKNNSHSILDVGCGEGFTLNYFHQLGWSVTGLDYSDFGCQSQNPDCTQFLIKGDILSNISDLISKGHKYDLIWIDNVLEHVIDPLSLLNSLAQISSDDGVLMIEVPNDFSNVQMHLLNGKYIDDPFWVVAPDHLSYFNKDGLINLCEASNWKCQSIMADFPIDWFLFNNFSNYKRLPETGKGAHKARLQIENLISQAPIEKVNTFYKAMAELGLGRQIIGIFKKQST